MFALSFESPTIPRYDEVDGELVQGETVSFANFGLTSLASSDQTQLLSDTKAYFLDVSSSQIIVWNPSAMETIGSIPLAIPSPPEGLRQWRLRFIAIDGQVVAYNDYLNEQDVLTARSDFWWIDPETDEVVGTDTTEQCGNLQSSVSRATNGDVYIGMSGGAAMEHALGLPGSFPPCAVRIRAGAREVDFTYLADLNDLTGFPTAGPISAASPRKLSLRWTQPREPARSVRVKLRSASR